LVGQDRVRNAFKAIGEGRDVIILDDGFQHRRISRDLDVVMIDSVSLFGNDCLFPRGMLREPLSALKRADLFVLTKVDRLGPEEKEIVVKRMQKLAPDKPVIMAQHKPSFLTDITGAAYSADSLRGEKICLASGIVDPEYLAFLVESLGGEIAEQFNFADHHKYDQADIDRLFVVCGRNNIDKIVVTKKDFVKIKDLDTSRIEDKLFVLNVVMDIVNGEEDLVTRLAGIMGR